MSLKEQAISGAKWTTMSTLIIAIVQISRLSILTRFLDKEDFGIVAILTFVLGLTNTFADLGFSVAIMHKQNLNQKLFSSLYWIQFIFFFVLFAMGALSSPFIASFYNESSITYLLPLVLFDLIANGIGRLYDTVLQKCLLFKIIAIRNIVSAVLSIVVALVLALMGFGIYSMILSTLFNTIMLNIWNFICGQKYYKIQFVVSMRECIPLAKIGFYQTGTQILDYFAAKFDVLIIGKLLGTETLGVYNLAKELVLKVILLINSIANKVLLPIFAKIQNDDEVLRETYCKVIMLLSKINFPISAAICALSSPIVAILYGKGYEDVASLMSILSIWSLFICIGNPVGNVAIAKGRTDLSFYYTIFRVFITIPAVFFASICNITIVAWVNVLVALVLFLIGWRFLLYNMIALSLKRYLKSFIGELLVVVVTTLAILIIMNMDILHVGENAITQVFVYGGIMLLTYISTEYIIFRKLYFVELLKDNK